jgi:crotonobetainyl-CoA:carnitine CoA-transferase CaiB-like acyl-CoA transferase
VAGNGDSIFHRLMQIIKRPNLVADPALAHNDGRVKQVELWMQRLKNEPDNAACRGFWLR